MNLPVLNAPLLWLMAPLSLNCEKGTISFNKEIENCYDAENYQILL